MPNYDFECNHCKKVFDAIIPIKDMDKAQRCACGGIAYRIFNTFVICTKSLVDTSCAPTNATKSSKPYEMVKPI